MCALSRRINQDRAFKGFGSKIGNAGFEFFRELIPPAPKSVRPGFDRVLVNADCIQRTNPAPAVIVDKTHRGLMPARFTNKAPL